LILTSLRAPGGEILSIKVERLDARADAVASAAPAAAPVPSKVPDLPAHPGAGEAAGTTAAGALGLPIQIGAHIRARGDMNFADAPWAGRVAPGLWIESFSLRPLERFGAQDIEYKGLTGSGFETPWLSDGNMCGTKGMAVALVGFAVRLKPSPDAAAYDCEYSGYFQSGLTVGPLRNGAPCRSTVANDPLEGIQVRIVKRSTPVPPDVATRGASPLHAAESKHAAGKGAASTRDRSSNGNAKATAKTGIPLRESAMPGKRDASISRNPSRSARSFRRFPTRRP
jgi:hypothetical protein